MVEMNGKAFWMAVLIAFAPLGGCEDGNGDTPEDAAPADGDGEVGCGDGVVQPDEECDDGNLVDGDGCDSNCEYSCNDDDECDDGIFCNGMESCEEHACVAGMNRDGDCGDGGLCTNGSCVAVGCGNGEVDPGEECDDGNNISGDGCSADCQDGIVMIGTWVSEIEALGSLEVPVVGATDANITMLVRIVIQESMGRYESSIEVCDLQTVTTPNPDDLVVTYTPDVLATFTDQTSVPAFNADVGDPVPIPDFSIQSGIDDMGEVIDEDSDGNPGVTLPSNIGGEIMVDAYAYLTIDTSLMGNASDPDTISGTTDFSVTGEVVDSDPEIPGGPISVTPADPPVDFEATRLEGQVPCDDVLPMFE